MVEESASKSCLTVMTYLPWVLLTKIYLPFTSPLYGENETCVVPQPEILHSQQGLARHAEKDSLIPFHMNGFPTEMSL